MYFCSICRQFISEEPRPCHNCDRLVCTKCIVVLEDENDIAYKCEWNTQLCTYCQCAGNCIRETPHKVNVGSKCSRCQLQYCGECWQNTSCGNGQHK